MKELIIKKGNNQITLIDKEDIQNQIDESISSYDSGTIPLLVTYDDDTSETLLLKGSSSSGSSSSGGSSGGGSSSGGSSADSSSND